MSKYRSSHQRYPVRKGIPGNFVNFIEKLLLRTPFYIAPSDGCFCKQIAVDNEK